jgi:heme/copper-type cytochrome/quinol oxidase subunit 1
VVASLVPATTVDTAIAVVEIATIGTVAGCPSTAVEGDAAAMWLGYTPCSTLEEHRLTHHFWRIQA